MLNRTKNVIPYVPSESAKLGFQDDIIKLDWNESSYPPFSSVQNAIQKAIGHSNYYPDITASILKEHLSEYTHCREEQIEVFNGADGALKAICDTYLNKSSVVALQIPGYNQMTNFVSLWQSRIMQFLEEESPSYMVPPDMVYLINPHNPTGRVISLPTIHKWLKLYPETLFVIDEAYYEFWGQTSAPLVDYYTNIIVVRSFSKAFGLAGLRCGYILTNPNNIADINLVRNGKDVNVLAQHGAIAALKDINSVRFRVEEIKKTRDTLENKLGNIAPYKSHANFVFLDFNRYNDEESIACGFVNYLKQHNIYIRYFGNATARITIGTPYQMESVYATIENYWKQV